MIITVAVDGHTSLNTNYLVLVSITRWQHIKRRGFMSIGLDFIEESDSSDSGRKNGLQPASHSHSGEKNNNNTFIYRAPYP